MSDSSTNQVTRLKITHQCPRISGVRLGSLEALIYLMSPQNSLKKQPEVALRMEATCSENGGNLQ